MRWKLILGVGFTAVAIASPRAQDGNNLGTRVLTVTYADGVTTSHIVTLNTASFLAGGLEPTTAPRRPRPEVSVTRLPFADLLSVDQLRQDMDGVLRVRRQEFDRDISALVASRPSDGTRRNDTDRLWLKRTLDRFEAWK